MRDEILDFLKNDDKAKSLIEINDFLGLKTSNELESLQNELNMLVKDGTIHETKKGKYLLMQDCKSLRVGKIEITKNGYAFLIQDDDNDIFISKDNLSDAIDGDVVLIDTFTRNNKLEGKVLKVLERKINTLVGLINIKDDVITFIPDNKKIDLDIIVENHFANLVDGHKVVIELTKQFSAKRFLGVITKIIGHVNDPDIDILTIAAKHGIELDFSNEVKNELKNIPGEVLESDKIGRKDLSNEMIFTIDGDDTKDIDDAVSIKKNSNYYELGVHIADVSYYVKENTKLYEEAYKRGTSSYLADKVLPMLPHELSNGICSLNPDVLRLAISCVMRIDYNGNTIDYDIFPSVIKSKKKMTYKCVNKILEDNIIPDGYENFAKDLITMNELAQILRKKKIKNGYLEFEVPEPKIVQDETGKCIDVIKRVTGPGENLIEDFMIAANETIASHFYNMDLPFIYRVHGAPKEEKIADFINLLKIMNLNVNTRGIDSSSKGMQRILNELKDYPDKEEILDSMLLRSMQKAIYSTNNIGHFGLALKNYTHFTSPIRRFPDTTVHMLIRKYLFENKMDNDTLNYLEKELIVIAEHSSEMEQASIDAEREVDDMKMAEYMENHIGEEFCGIISTVTNFGFFVELPNLIEGLVHISSLNGYYSYVPDLLALVSNDNKTMYRLGDRINVKVIGADKNMCTVDFEVINGNN